jgi:hypothetical protein
VGRSAWSSDQANTGKRVMDFPHAADQYKPSRDSRLVAM